MSDETKVSDEIVSANEKAPTTLESAATEPAPAVEASPEASHDLPPVLNPERIELTPEAMARLDAMLEGESEAIARDPTPKEERAEYVVLHSSAPAAIPDGSTVRLDAQEKADAEGAGFTFCTREEFEEKIALAESARVSADKAQRFGPTVTIELAFDGDIAPGQTVQVLGTLPQPRKVPALFGVERLCIPSDVAWGFRVEAIEVGFLGVFPGKPQLLGASLEGTLDPVPAYVYSETAVGSGRSYDIGEFFLVRVTNIHDRPLPLRAVAFAREASLLSPEPAPPAPAEPTRSYRVLGVPEGVEGVARLSIVSLTFEQLAAAVARGFALSEVQPPCPTCEGNGHVSPFLGLSGDGTCPTCRGSGTTTPVPSPQELSEAVERMETGETASTEEVGETGGTGTDDEEDDPDLASWISDSQGGTLP